MSRSRVAPLVLLIACSATTAHAQAPAAGTIRVPGAELPYLLEGQGRPCIVYGSQLYYPRTFSPRFKSTFRCLHVPERGFVADAQRRNGVPFGISEAVADIEAARNQLGMDRFVLVGHSIHGLAVLAYAAQYPAHVSNVIAIGAPPGVPLNADSVRANRSRHFSPERQAQHAGNRKALDSLIAAHPGRRSVATYVANAALYWADSTFDATPLWAGMAINDTLSADLQRTPFAWDASMAPVTVPAFVALGRHDYVVPPNLWLGVQSPFTALTVHVFEQAGHTPQLESPAEFDARVLEWLARVP